MNVDLITREQNLMCIPVNSGVAQSKRISRISGEKLLHKGMRKLIEYRK
jgi:hypothetical protein